MRTCLTCFLVIFLVFAYTISLFAQQNTVHPIDSVMDLSPNYLPTSYSNMHHIEFEPLIFESIDTGMSQMHQFNLLLKTENIYQSLGIGGQAHQSIVFDYERDMGFLYQELPYPLYSKTQSDLVFPKLQTTYSKIAFTFGIPKENELYATFAKYMKGVTIAFNINASLNEWFVDYNTRNFCGDFLIHYELPSSFYGFKASAIINNVNNAEIGGINDVNSYKEREDYYLMNPRASSKNTTIDIALQNYLNIINSNKKYFGTFTHDFQFIQTKLNYYDQFESLPNNPYYGVYYSTIATNDTTQIHQFKNALQWSNFMPYKEMSNKNNFFHIAGGILHDYAKVENLSLYLMDSNYHRNSSKIQPFKASSLYLFARTHIRLFKLMDISAKISYSVYGYTKDDLIANAGISWSLNKEKEHSIALDANYYRNNPEYIMQYVVSNHFLWDTTFVKQNVVQLKALWNYQNYNIAVSYYYLNKLVYLTEELRPIQDYNTGNMIQVSTLIPFRYKNFGTTANLNLQYCSNEVIYVPLFSGKLSVFYIFELLKKRLKIQIGTDLMYNTSYYADGYLPVLHTFYCQNSQSIGNFIFWDANITFQIDRINFFFRMGNLLPPFIQKYRNFTTPFYPENENMLNTICIGISWKFFD